METTITLLLLGRYRTHMQDERDNEPLRNSQASIPFNRRQCNSCSKMPDVRIVLVIEFASIVSIVQDNTQSETARSGLFSCVFLVLFFFFLGSSHAQGPFLCGLVTYKLVSWLSTAEQQGGDLMESCDNSSLLELLQLVIPGL